MYLRIGRDKVATLAEAVQDSQNYLLKKPVTTIEFVKYLQFLDECANQIDAMENDLDYCKELYDIMEEFDITIPGDDMSNYLSLSVDMGSLRSLVDNKVEKRPKTMRKFNDQMNKDISVLIADVGVIKNECLVRLIIA